MVTGAGRWLLFINGCGEAGGNLWRIRWQKIAELVNLRADALDCSETMEDGERSEMGCQLL